MSRITLGSNGWTYLMVSASLDGLVKIGASTDDPRLRAKQLTASTSSPTPLVVAYSRWNTDCTATEAALHKMFDAERINEGREFFQIPLHKVIMALDNLVDQAKVENIPLPFAELFATFPDDGTARELTPEEQKRCRVLEAKLSLQN